MFINSPIALFLIGTTLLIGCTVGVITALSIARKSTTKKIILVAAISGGIAFLIASAVTGAAGNHQEWVNGRLADTTSSGANLYWQNRLFENQHLISFSSSILAAGLATTISLRRASKTTKRLNN